MSASSAGTVRWGRERARIGSWRGDRSVAFLAPLPDAPVPSAEFLRRCLDTLVARGFSHVVTGALSPQEQAGFLAAGFSVEEELHLLSIDLDSLPAVSPGLRLARVSRRRRAGVLEIDSLAFPSFWQFDRFGLNAALRATPSTRFRVALTSVPGSGRHRPVAYAICGRADTRGFVQRLAVHPAHQRHGTGRRLLVDGLRWMAAGGARRAVVNTQTSNEAALSLYLDVGFRREPVGLSVLSAGLA